MNDSGELLSFIASMSGEGNLRVEENLGEGYVRLRVSEAERRQAKHDIQHVEDVVIELLRNARDAGAQNVYLATLKEEGVRTLLFLDDGDGVPEDMRERIFDARVTSKLETMKMDRWGVHGRGMALFSVRQNADEAYVVCSGVKQGSSFKVVCDTAKLNERSDQSTWPQAIKDDSGAYVCARGPHNIIRTACEFALEERDCLNVFLGSPTEIAAVLYDRARKRIESTTMLFMDSEEELPVVDRLGFAEDASDFIRIAASMGLDLSERTAHRILGGKIALPRSLAQRMLRERDKQAGPRSVDLSRDRRSLKIEHKDLESFSRAVERDFTDIAQAYYLELEGSPRIRVAKGRITVVLDLRNAE